MSPVWLVFLINRRISFSERIQWTRNSFASSLEGGPESRSASASEIVTGALQDHDRAIIVGETTFGKALVQSVYRISEGAALALEAEGLEGREPELQHDERGMAIKTSTANTSP